ncbi:hypothetical protein [Shinella sp.]|uniref:hypothetical protein n=1 Tax=Shinella sp. TaxID=1870904 RepID=UPI003F70202E
MSENFDRDFGALRAPDKVDDWEKDVTPASLSDLGEAAPALAELKKLAQYRILSSAMRAKNYIWVMEQDGTIKIAIEELAYLQSGTPYPGYPRRRSYKHPSEEKKLGHPTLVGASEARIAGELFFDRENEQDELKWFLNVHSGRYCRQKPPGKHQIDNVVARFKALGVDVEVDYE